MTYPIAELCFENKDFLSFYSKDSSLLSAEITHDEAVYGYVARLKYSRSEGEQKTIFFSKPIVFRVAKPKCWMPFEIVSIVPVDEYINEI